MTFGLCNLMNEIESRMVDLGITATDGDITWTRHLNYTDHSIRSDFSKNGVGFTGSLLIRQIGKTKEAWYQVIWVKATNEREPLDAIYAKSTEEMEGHATTIVSKLTMHLL